ncbi:MAG: nitroreductase family protein [Streptosporangiaceae bacterium]
MDLNEVMRTAGSTRRHRPDPVPDEVIHRVLDSARFAPSGGNRQPWRIITVTDSAVRAELSRLYRQSWYQFHAPLFTAPGEQPQPNHYADHLHLVPVQLIVLVSIDSITTTIQALDASRVVGGAGIYPFVQNLILGIRAEGLGATLTTVLVPVEDEVRRLLRIPDGFALAAHLGVGWPERPLPARLSRRPVEDFATVDYFDGTAFRG